MAKHWNKPASKLCACGAIFERIGNSNDLRWENTKNCPSCRKKRVAREEKDRRPGNYEVRNPMIDRFISGKL